MSQCSQHTIAEHLQTGPAEPGRPGQAVLAFLAAGIFVNTVLAACHCFSRSNHGKKARQKQRVVYVMDNWKRKGSVKHVNSTTRSFILVWFYWWVFDIWSFHFFSCLFQFFSLFLTFPDQRTKCKRFALAHHCAPAHLVEVQSWPFTSAARIHGAHTRPSTKLRGCKRGRNVIRLFVMEDSGRLWKTQEDSNTLDKLGAT